MNRDKDEMPVLHNLQPHEIKAIKQLFQFYDIGNTGKIRQYLAHNLFKKLGLGIKIDVLNYMVSLKDILVLADQKCPPDPNSEDNIEIFCRMVSRHRNGQAAPVSAKHIVNFMASIQNVPPSEAEANLLLARMVEFDDCTESPEVPAAVFKKEALSAYKELQMLQEHNDLLIK